MGVASSFIQHDKDLKYIENSVSASDIGSQGPCFKFCASCRVQCIWC